MAKYERMMGYKLYSELINIAKSKDVWWSMTISLIVQFFIGGLRRTITFWLFYLLLSFGLQVIFWFVLNRVRRIK